MAEPHQHDRLQPSLLDRLTDLEPRAKSEPKDSRLLSQRQLRRSVVRDLEWLLNTGRYSAIHPLSDFEWVEKSVLNFGVPDLAGVTSSSVDMGQLERELRAAILAYEPRINRQKLEVSGRVENTDAYRNVLQFEISLEIWGDPAPMHLMLKTEMDLETGQVSVQDTGA